MVRDEVACALDEDVRPVALLVDDATYEPGVINPRGRRAAREALDATEGGVLSHVSTWPSLSIPCLTYLDDD